MIGIVVAAHGDLAQALLKTAYSVLGEEHRPVAVSVLKDDDTIAYENRFEEAVAQVQSDDGVIVLTDMFGGTPSNVGMTLHEPGRIEVLTGVNLPMVIKAVQLSSRGAHISEAARQIHAAGMRAITVASDLLAVNPPALSESEVAL
ncbi:MAG: PTS sugar transporter subunit IIA [Myxococcota bacterium]